MRGLDRLQGNCGLTHVTLRCKNNFMQNAIEYYESIGCEKYKYFQVRIQNLLVKPLVQSILRGKSSTLSYKKDEIERRQR